MPPAGATGGYQLFRSGVLAPILTDPTFTGLDQAVPVTVDSSANTLTFNFNTGFAQAYRIICQVPAPVNGCPRIITPALRWISRRTSNP
jgi:hypothetical protein